MRKSGERDRRCGNAKMDTGLASDFKKPDTKRKTKASLHTTTVALPHSGNLGGGAGVNREEERGGVGARFLAWPFPRGVLALISFHNSGVRQSPLTIAPSQSFPSLKEAPSRRGCRWCWL